MLTSRFVIRSSFIKLRGINFINEYQSLGCFRVFPRKSFLLFSSLCPLTSQEVPVRDGSRGEWEGEEEKWNVTNLIRFPSSPTFCWQLSCKINNPKYRLQPQPSPADVNRLSARGAGTRSGETGSDSERFAWVIAFLWEFLQNSGQPGSALY